MHNAGRRLTLAGWVLLLLAACGSRDTSITPFPEPPPADTQAQGPNILLILVDDLGFTDLGLTGGEISTPNIDRLALGGMLLTGLHAAPSCSPTRAALLTGVSPHLAGLGTMSHGVQANQRGRPGYEGYLNDRVVTLPTLLRDAGYRTYMAGKWHLGGGAGQTPDARGFERSWSLLGGGASHFQDAAGLIVFERKATYLADGERVDPPPGFFSSTFYTDRLIHYLEEDRGSTRPWFAYAAYTAPHWPLHAPDDMLQRYRGRYDKGYEWLRDQRIAGARQRGLFPADAAVTPLPAFVPRWESLTPEQQQRSARSMEIYAALVEHLDAEVGRLLDYLATSGQLDNTLVVFTSDNGPEGNDIGALPFNRWWLPLAFDNSLDNMGRRGSYVWYGEGWGAASAGPLSLFKAFPTGGGTRVPALVRLPGEAQEQIRLHGRMSMMDLFATLLEAADVTHPGERYRGKSVLAQQGVSRWQDWRRQRDWQARLPLVIELYGRRTVLFERYKGVLFPPPLGDGRWQLYDLSRDPGESSDLAGSLPEVVAQIEAHWQAYADVNGVVLPEGDAAYVTPSLESER